MAVYLSDDTFSLHKILRIFFSQNAYQHALLFPDAPSFEARNKRLRMTVQEALFYMLKDYEWQPQKQQFARQAYAHCAIY